METRGVSGTHTPLAAIFFSAGTGAQGILCAVSKLLSGFFPASLLFPHGQAHSQDIKYRFHNQGNCGKVPQEYCGCTGTSQDNCRQCQRQRRADRHPAPPRSFHSQHIHRHLHLVKPGYQNRDSVKDRQHREGDNKPLRTQKSPAG